MAGDRSADLLRRFKDGDERAFQNLFERDLPLLSRRVARKLPKALRRRLSIADVLQDARLAAFQQRADFEDRGPHAFRNWVCGIAENKAREAARRHAGTAKRATDREVSRGARPDTAQFGARMPSPSEAAVHDETAERIQRVLDTLPQNYAQVLRFTRLEGMTLREAGEYMGRSREAVKKLYGRAFLRFEEAFRRLEGNE